MKTSRRHEHSLVAFSGFGAIALVIALAACSSSSKSSNSTGTSPAGASPSTTKAAATGAPINVGVIGSFSGSYVSSLGQGATVAPAWADWINANGGIDGHPVNVLLEDDQGSPAVGQADAQALMSKGVVAIIPASDNVISAYDSAVIAKGIPLIAGANVNPDWAVKAGMFTTTTGIDSSFPAYIDLAVKYGHAKKYAYVYCAEVAICADGVPILHGLATSAGIGFTSLPLSATAPSYTAQCLELKQAGVDYVDLAVAAEAGVKLIQSCQAQGYSPTYGTSDLGNGPAFDLPGLTMFGTAFSFPLAYTGQPVATFTAAMKEYAKNDNWMGGDAGDTWSGLQVLAKAIEDANVSPSTPVTAQDVLNGLYSFKDENLGGLLANGLTYVKGQPVGKGFNPCYFIMGVQGGKLTAPAGLTTSCVTNSG